MRVGPCGRLRYALLGAGCASRPVGACARPVDRMSVRVTTSSATPPPAPRLAQWPALVASLLAAAFVALALATIPYGAPMPQWYFTAMGAVGALAAAAALVGGRERWRSLVWWPVPAILAAWALSILWCGFPAQVAARSWGMAFYALLFLAAQVTCWTSHGRRTLGVLLLATLIAIALDLWWQRATGRSLIRDVRAETRIWNGQWWTVTTPSGSLGNRNDQAVMGVLAPLCACVIPSAWAWAVPALALMASGYVALVGTSRQLLMGLCAGVGVTALLRLPPRTRWWAAGAAVLLVAAAVAAHPGTRARVMEISQNPFGDRGLPVAYGVSLFASHPVVGVGPSMFGHHYVIGVREGWTFAGEPLRASGMPWVHCLPVEIACEMGAVGLLAYGAVVWGFVRRVRTAIRMGGSARDMGVAVAAAAASMALMGIVDLTFIKDWVRICWWLLIGLGFTAPTLPGRVSLEPVPAPEPPPSVGRGQRERPGRGARPAT